jgi:hypothetical protein
MLVRLDQAGVSVEIDLALLAPASGLARRPDNNLPEGCEMPFKVPSQAGQSSPGHRKLRLLSFRISPATCVTKQFQLEKAASVGGLVTHPVRSQPAHPGFRKSDQSVECFGAEASRLAACGRD